MGGHETSIYSEETPNCAWCGAERSDRWVGHGPKRYCSSDCEMAAGTGWTTPSEDHAVIPLIREQTERDALENALTRMAAKESMLDIQKVMPEVLFTRLWHVFKNMNLYMAIRETRTDGALFSGRAVGWAKSEESGKHIAVDMSVTGLSGVPKSRCRLLVYGADGTEPVLVTDEVIARVTGKPLPPRARPTKKEPSIPRTAAHYPDQSVLIAGSAEFLNGEIKVSVSVTNESLHPVKDVNVLTISYPSDSIRPVSDSESRLPILKGGQTKETTFHFQSTADCVRGEIVAATSYSDANGVTHTIGTEPIPLSAVCVLSVPEVVDAPTLERELAGLEYGEIAINLENLTSRQMYERAIAALPELRFHPVSTSLGEADGLVMCEVNGWSRGLHTKRKLGLSIIIYGPEKGLGCSCRIVISAEDDTIIFPAIEEVRRALSI